MADFGDPNPFGDNENEQHAIIDAPPVDEASEAPATPAKPASPPTQQRQPFRGYPGLSPKTGFCCARDEYLHSDGAEILIADALKMTDHTGKIYIAYVIRTGNSDARRRYSEFESLRSGLVKLYPTLIIPPIPSKQSLGDYAIKQSRAKEDATMISRRKRMLQAFLNRIARHPILSNEHTFHRFLDGEVSWSEVLHSPPMSLAPKNVLRAPPHNPTDANPHPGYAALPSPSTSVSLRHPDQRFMDSEAFTDKFASHLSGTMEKVTRRTMKRWSDYSQDNAELGAILNGFSLSETGQLAVAVERTGQAVDTTYVSTTQLLQDLEQSWAEPLHEYSQFAEIIKKLLVFRHQKHAQYEMTKNALENKREVMDEFERSEAEAQRLQNALSGSSINATAPGRRGATLLSGEGDEDIIGPSSPNAQSATSHSMPMRRKSTSGGGLLSAISYSIQGMMDVDPEAARRNNMSKTKESISQLEDALHISTQDLKYTSATIQADLDRFQRQKVADMREMCISMARIHKEWCRKNLDAWEEARAEILKIQPHPNRQPEDIPLPTSPTSPNGPSSPSAKTITANESKK
ncbi:Sorting nexin, cytoplasm-to-vacuole targeting pathway/endosomal sorting [Serendipita sp. 400]|nr:Sorting nexin, cytoplasm-to-vacuole targeting pathway/endosomal sorting [Serendipita sp. 400]